MKYAFAVLLMALVVGCSSDSSSRGGMSSGSGSQMGTPSTSNTTNSPQDRLHNPQTGETQQ
jgi:hypothetical protein